MKSKIIAATIEALYACPELRLGQLISNAARAGGWDNDDVFYCPDHILLNGLKKLAERGK